MKIQKPEPEDTRSGNDTLTPQCRVSMAWHPKNRLYIGSGVCVHILFNQKLLGGLIKLIRVIKIQAGEKLIHISQIGSLHKALRHLPLPASAYHYDENTIANLLSFEKLVDEYYIICNTRVNDAIYVQSKDNRKYLRFQKDHKFNLYDMHIIAKQTWKIIVTLTLWRKGNQCFPYLIKIEPK